MKCLLALAIAGTWCLGQSAEVQRWADHWADKYGVERELVYAVIEAESGGNPRAVSSAGAAGIMQLMPDTARQLEVRNPFDPRENLTAGSRLDFDTRRPADDEEHAVADIVIIDDPLPASDPPPSALGL